MKLKYIDTSVEDEWIPLDQSKFYAFMNDFCSDDKIRQERASNTAKDFMWKIFTPRLNFFTPYKRFDNVTDELQSSIISTSVGTAIAALFTIGAAGATVSAGFKLFLAGGYGITGIFNKTAKESALDNLTSSGILFIVALACNVVAVATALITALMMPFYILRMASRSAATLVAPIINYFNKGELEVEPKEPEVEEKELDDADESKKANFAPCYP